MAYAYNSIDDLLNNQQQQKQTIFGAPESGTPQSPQGQGQEGVKTSTEGDLGAGGAGSGSPEGQKAVSDEQTQTTEANKAAVKANVGKTAQPKVFNDIQTQIDANNQKLQDQANSYVTNQKAKQNYAIDNSSIDKAISGDSEQNNKVRTLLNRQNIDNVEAFDPGDIAVKDASLVNNDSGLKQLVSRGQGPQYSSGMAAFDLQSLRRAPGFDNLINMIRGNEGNLEKTGRDYTVAKPKEVTDYGTANLASAKTSANSFLDQQRADLDANDLAEMQAANARLAGIRTNGVDEAIRQQALQQARDAVTGNLASVNSRATKFLNQVNVDPRQYLNVHGDYAQNDFTTQEEANRFNSIMGLLGKGDIRSGAQALGPDYNFDQNSLQQALQSGALGLRAAKDQESQATIDRILKDAQQRADQEDARRSVFDLNAVANNQAQLARGELDQGLLSYFNPSAIDASKYASLDSRDLNAQDVLAQSDADRLNELYADLGSQNVAQAGSGAGAGYSFDKASYLAALKGMLEGSRSKAASATQAAAEAKAKAVRDAEIEAEKKRLAKTATVGGIPTGITISDMKKIQAANTAGQNYVNDRLGQIGMANASPTPLAITPVPKKLVDTVKGQGAKIASSVKSMNPFR